MQELLPRAGRRSDREKNWRVVSVWLAGQEQEALKRSSTSWLWENTQKPHTSAAMLGPAWPHLDPHWKMGREGHKNHLLTWVPEDLLLAA